MPLVQDLKGRLSVISEEIKALRKLVDSKADNEEIETTDIIGALSNKSFFAADRSLQFYAEDPKPVAKEDALSTDEVVSKLSTIWKRKTGS